MSKPKIDKNIQIPDQILKELYRLENSCSRDIIRLMVKIQNQIPFRKTSLQKCNDRKFGSSESGYHNSILRASSCRKNNDSDYKKFRAVSKKQPFLFL